MDQDRQIRFVIPPFLLLASLLWGAHLGHSDLSAIWQPELAKNLLGVLAAAVVVIVPIGFLISALSVLLLRLLAMSWGKPTYEAVLSDSTLERIWCHLRSKQEIDKRLTLYAAATFDHELLPAGIHAWLLRRWNSFNVAAHSIVALLLAHFVGFIFSIPQVRWWWVSTLVLVGLLCIIAFNAWRETMEMIEFQSYRRQKTDTKKDDAA
jgi:hypothetical protein